ncbi:hypothetical protein LY76DRAFT_649414 [Colletotrichum caudatum]|nr:hypothetical protein LY76DRAFT_649414 [Colletotrichum caudatum]
MSVIIRVAGSLKFHYDVEKGFDGLQGGAPCINCLGQLHRDLSRLLCCQGAHVARKEATNEVIMYDDDIYGHDMAFDQVMIDLEKCKTDFLKRIDKFVKTARTLTPTGPKNFVEFFDLVKGCGDDKERLSFKNDNLLIPLDQPTERENVLLKDHEEKLKILTCIAEQSFCCDVDHRQAIRVIRLNPNNSSLDN